MSLMTIRRRRAANKGFNLIEAAIVLGIVGLVVGGIWVAATSVYANLRSKTATDTLLQVAQGVRALYSTSASTNLPNGTDITPQLAQANVFPSSVLTTTPNLVVDPTFTVNAWGGNLGVYVAASRNGIAGGGFSVVYTQIPAAACTDFVVRNTGSGRDSGMYNVTGVVGAAPAAVAANAGGNLAANGGSLPLATVTGGNVCNSAAANVARNVAFFFDLRG
jgi:type II secretory pathway pseudopilin PulG